MTGFEIIDEEERLYWFDRCEAFRDMIFKSGHQPCRVQPCYEMRIPSIMRKNCEDLLAQWIRIKRENEHDRSGTLPSR